MCLYLTKRGATYYFRRAIPDELQAAFDGRTEFTFSLRTKDKEEAKRLRSEHALRTDRLIDEAQRQLGESGQVPADSAPVDREWLSEFASEQAEFAARKEAEQRARREARRVYRDEWRERLHGSTAEMPPRYAALRDLLREREEQGRGKARSETPGKVTAVPPVEPAKSAPHDAAMLDTTIVDLWAAERKPEQKGIDTHRSTARWLYERVGKKPVDQLTKDDVRTFKKALVGEGQSASNIRQKLSHLRTLLQWAEDNGHVESNVAKGVTMKDPDAAKNKRKPFDLAALNAIFGSPVYTKGARPIPLKGEAGYWLPLLALFTGARLEELGQLRPGDIAEETYPDADGAERSAWFIHIREDEVAGLRIKNAASERRVPVHPELVRLGFIAFVEAANGTKQERLFPLLKPNIYGRLTAKWGENWSVYRRTVCGITDKRMVFHSFRHTFKDYARHAGILEGVQRQIMGHSSGDVADEYGSGYSLHQLVEGMRHYKVPGLKLPNSPTSL
jgi:integrase